jgi:crotonobetainyl-CoA:carnitine CoA-transferase CaiB-like acyl-CoA transferase
VILRTSAPARWRSGASGPRTSTRRNPRAIYARVSGYGQTGRYAHRPGFASAGEAISGLRYINGYPDQAPPRTASASATRSPRQSAFQGILLALYARDAAATGQVVDAAIVDACFAMIESTRLEYEKTGFDPRAHRPAAPAHRAVNVYRPRTASGS